MSDKVFWSVLGGLLLGFIACIALIVYPKMSEYNKASATLKSRVTKMKKYAAMPPDELPTLALNNKKQNYIDEWSDNVEAARRFHEDREARVTGSISPNQAVWVAGYRDDFSNLAERYRRVANLPEEEELPFEEMTQFNDPDLTLADYEKAWRVQKLLIGEVIAAKGVVEEYVTQTSRQRQSQNKEDVRPNFKLDQVTIKAKLPPKELTGILTTVLGHPDLSLELDSLIVGKDSRKLIADVVQQDKTAAGEEPPKEPPVVAKMSFNVLTWSPTEENPPEDEDE